MQGADGHIYKGRVDKLPNLQPGAPQVSICHYYFCLIICESTMNVVRVSSLFRNKIQLPNRSLCNFSTYCPILCLSSIIIFVQSTMPLGCYLFDLSHLHHRDKNGKRVVLR